MSTALTNIQINESLAKLPGWTFAKDKLSREYRFANFTEAMGFITEMAFACEKANHHPELFNVCLLYTSPSPRDRTRSRMPSSA